MGNHITEASVTITTPDKGERIEGGSPVFVFTAYDAEESESAAALYDAYMELRRDFVQRMKWFNSRPDDTDPYDNPNLASRYFLRLDESADGEARAHVGMRLTRSHNVRSSLSWSMLNDDIKRDILDNHTEELEWLNSVAHANKLWDLTRLVNQKTEGIREGVEVLEAMLSIFGAAYKETVEADEEKDPREVQTMWFFLTTKDVKEMLDKCGIGPRVLAHGRVDVHDDEESYFCVIDPKKYRSLEDSPQAMYRRTYKLISNGLQNAHAL